MRKLTLYSRPECHLCEALLADLMPLLRADDSVETVDVDTTGDRANTVLLDPVVADNVTPEGRELLESWQVDGLDPLWPLGLQIEGYTTYTPEQAVACKGPGES